MSGGSFDYAFHKVNDFIEQLKQEIKINNIQDSDGYARNFSDETINELQGICKSLTLMSSLMKDVEWLYSGDIGEDTFVRGLRK